LARNLYGVYIAQLQLTNTPETLETVVKAGYDLITSMLRPAINFPEDALFNCDYVRQLDSFLISVQLNMV
jgi:hypothetical protein